MRLSIFLKKFALCFICLMFVLKTTPAFSQDIKPLEAGEPAPFSGILIPTLKAAQMTAELERSEEICQARVDLELQKVENQSSLILSNCTSSREILENMYNSQLSSQRKYIEFLEIRMSSNSQISRELVFVIGMFAGIGITIGTGYVMQQLTN